MALTAAGMDPIDAAELMARAAVEMAVGTKARSSAAIRQERYRRNKSVTRDAQVETSQTVTNRNETVTPLRSAETPISITSSSKSSSEEEKKESKKERKPRKRYAPLPDCWTPSVRSYQVAEEHGVNAQIVEQIFRDYLKSSGKLYADYDAAFNNFLRNQRQFNGNRTTYGTPPNKSGGSLIAALDRKLAQLAGEDGADSALPESNILRLSDGSIRRS